MTTALGTPPGGGAAHGGQADQLISAGWAAAGGVPGTLAWAPRFEAVVADLQQALPGERSSGPMWYPPVMLRADAERAGYAESFLGLLGSVHALAGHGQGEAGPAQSGPPDSSQGFSATEAVLVPAMCYHIYPLLANQAVSRLVTFDLAGYCYRHERTHDYGRLRSYRVREHLAVGTANAALGWRDEQLELTSAFFRRLGLPARVQAATDPFFGRGGRLLKAAQLEQQLKFEFICQIATADPGTAIASANYHKDHFGAAFGIGVPGGGVAHSACLGFGLERIALALIRVHGNHRRNWPDITSPAVSLRGCS
jgi:seryl-tRNA synthetase